MRILLINWQDRENPEAGGAETHLHEIFGRLAGRGHRVRAVVGGWPGAPASVELDGIQVERAGTRQSFPLQVRRAVRAALHREPADVVVEDINKVPLYSPRWVPVPVVALVPHLFGETAFKQASWPVAALVWASERWIPGVYRDTPFEAISRGTAEDLVRRGITPDRITVIPPGIDHSVYHRPPDTGREAAPTAIYVGRLKRYKGLDIVLQAFADVLADIPGARLDIAGQGDDRPRLESIATRLGVDERVRFLGWISTEDKIERLRRAWVTVYPSPKEGWGITNVEAAACGTPAIASDSPGLRESVADGISGWLVAHHEVEAWRGALVRALTDPGTAEEMRPGCIAHARSFSWDRAADETEAHLNRVLGGAPGQREP